MAVATFYQQFQLLAFARWHAFRNSLRRKQKRFELLFKILYWLSGFSTIVFGGLAFSATTYFLSNKPVMIIAVFWILFATWQIVPLALEGQSPALDFREIARYPIPFRLFFTLNLSYGLLDPGAVISISWAVAAWLGVLLSPTPTSPTPFHASAMRFGLALLLFLPLNLFMNRVIFTWMSRLTQTRSGRERTMAATLFVIVALQFIFWLAPTQLDRLPWLPAVVRAVGNSLPPGWAANVALSSSRQLQAAVALMLTTLCFAALFYRQSLRTFAGDIPSEGSRPSHAVQVSPGWSFLFASSSTCAMLEKEIRYILKDPRIFTNLLMVWGFAFVSTAGSGMWRDAFHLDPTRSGTMLYPAMTGYSLLVINMLCFNIFGNDPPGFQRWLLSPVPVRNIIIAKNLAFAGIVLTDVLVITAIFRLRAPIPLGLLAKTVFGVAYATLAMVALGNVLSVWFPKKIVPGKLSGKNVSEAGIMISLAFMAALGASWFLVTGVAARSHKLWLPYALFAVFFVIAAALYAASLRVAPGYMIRRLDNLLAELG